VSKKNLSTCVLVSLAENMGGKYLMNFWLEMKKLYYHDKYIGENNTGYE